MMFKPLRNGADLPITINLDQVVAFRQTATTSDLIDVSIIMTRPEADITMKDIPQGKVEELIKDILTREGEIIPKHKHINSNFYKNDEQWEPGEQYN